MRLKNNVVRAIVRAGNQYDKFKVKKKRKYDGKSDFLEKTVGHLLRESKNEERAWSSLLYRAKNAAAEKAAADKEKKRTSVRQTQQIVKHRLQSFLRFLEIAAEEDSNLLTSNEERLMQGRRRKCTFLQDPTFLFVGVALIQNFGENAELLLFSILFVCVGCTNLRNVRIATDTEKDAINNFENIVTYIKELWSKSWSADMVKDLAETWIQKKFQKKAYDTNAWLSRRAPSSLIGESTVIGENVENIKPEVVSEGLAYSLWSWKELCNVLLGALYRNPSTENTTAVLRTVAGLPPIPAMQVARYIGLWDNNLYDYDREFNVQVDAKPLCDWIVGDEVDWGTFKLGDYRPKVGRDYKRILWQIRMRGEGFFMSHIHGRRLVPTWVQPSLSVFEGALCDDRKRRCKGTVREYFVPLGDYKPLLRKFEEVFVKEGQLLCYKRHAFIKTAPSGPSITMPKLRGYCYRLGQRYFQTINAFCERTMKWHPSDTRAARLLNITYKTCDKMVICQTSNNLRHLPEKIKNGEEDVSDDIGFLMSTASAIKRRKLRKNPEKYTMVYDVKVLVTGGS